MLNQKGNVLFLILIAVALFAALSYAVTQSSRGGGSVDNETNEITAGQILQYGTIVRFGVQRIKISGVDDADIEFGGGYLDSFPCTSGSGCVYASDGGGVTHQATPDGDPWYHYSNNTTGVIDSVGTASNDFYIHTTIDTLGLCQAINKGLGIAHNPVASSNGGGSTNINAYPGEPAACYEHFPGAGTYGFYFVVLER